MRASGAAAMRVKPEHLGDSRQDSGKRHLKRAQSSWHMSKKMVAVIENTNLRTRMKAFTSNRATTSTFIFGIAIQSMFQSRFMAPTPDAGDPEYDAKMFVQSLFFCLSAVSALLLLLTVSILKIQLTLFALTPDHCFDDLLQALWLVWLPELLITVAGSCLSALLPLWAFSFFGSGWEFYLVLVIAILCAITSFVYWALAKRLLHQLYKDCLKKQDEHIEQGGEGVYPGQASSTKRCASTTP